MRRRVDLDDGVRALDLDVIQIVAGHQMPDALACIRFGVDDVTRSDALQDARVLLRHRFRPDVADAGVQQVSGGDHRRLGRHRTAESSQSDDQNAPVVACHAIILSAAVRGDAPVPPSWTPPILRAAVNGTASTS